nr:RNA-directed DNA polymerase, eukaryota [Tanacetum cinerariifolium]
LPSSKVSIHLSIMGIDDWHEVLRKKHGYRSYEDDVAKISISICVSNLPETFSAKDLFHACNKYGLVVDSYIPLKRSKEGKRFGFVKFINVFNVERLVGILCTIWVGRCKFQANLARFGRTPLNGRNIRDLKRDDRHLGGFKASNVRLMNGNKRTRTESFTFVLKSNHPNNLPSSNKTQDSSPAIVLDDDCLSVNDLSCAAIGKIKDINAIPNLSVILNDEGFDNVKISYLEDNSLPYRKVCVATNVSTIINDRIKIIVKGKVYWTRIRELEPWSPEFDDEFCESSSDDESVGEEKNSPSMDDESPQDKSSEDPFGIYNILNKQDIKEADQNCNPSHPPGFTPKEANVQTMENVGYSFTWAIKSAKKMSKLDRFLISEGLLLKFPSLFAICLDRHLSDHRPIILREVVADYGPSPFHVYQSWFYKKGFDNLIKDSWCSSSSNDSNKIILLKKKLQALKASIKKWCKNDIKRSNDTCFSIKARLSDLDKLFDNGLSNEELVTERISLLKELHNLNKCHSLDMAQKANVRWAIEGDENSKYFHGIINKKRSQLAIRGVITDREWIDEPCKVKNEFLKHFANRFECPFGPCIDIDSDMFKKLSTEQVADLECDVTFDEIKKADILKNDLVNAIREFFILSKFPPGCNSSFIALIPKKHDAKFVKDYKPISLIGCFNKIVSKILANRLKMVISELISDVQSAFVSNRQILDDGEWIDEPCKVKNEFLKHFANRSECPSGPCIDIDSDMFKKLSTEQVADLECDVTFDEIKKAVWDCGTNKSLGPDGFSFDFIRTFWDILKHDFVNAIREFFISSKFPPGCNSSFIALIPKKHDAKFVKDYQPISLIGCFYKIVSMILANRLKMVISELISDVQSASVSNRQILNGPFILNKLISWRKSHKSKAMIFKVDFEKAFDSVRWDFLDSILRNFRFGLKWRGWIQGCLLSAMGSILVNGSPTAEFKFHKGLKQGDPLSPYLFILVMESLHFSFNNILNAGLFKGIRFDDSLTLSHLFYADDAVFIGKRDRANILSIVRMLKCFFMASGLQINIHKSKLMGIGVSNEEVLTASNIIGCSTFSAPFCYLGVKVGMFSSRRKAWDEVIAPLGVLRDLESLRRKNFNGAEINEKKFSMISWNKVLASKQKGGLGSVSSLSPWNCILRELNSLLSKGINLLALLKKKVGNGVNTLFCDDCWINEAPLSRTFPRLYALEIRKGSAGRRLLCYVVADLEVPQPSAFWILSSAYGSSF